MDNGARPSLLSCMGTLFENGPNADVLQNDSDNAELALKKARQSRHFTYSSFGTFLFLSVKFQKVLEFYSTLTTFLVPPPP